MFIISIIIIFIVLSSLYNIIIKRGFYNCSHYYRVYINMYIVYTLLILLFSWYTLQNIKIKRQYEYGLYRQYKEISRIPRKNLSNKQISWVFGEFRHTKVIPNVYRWKRPSFTLSYSILVFIPPIFKSSRYKMMPALALYWLQL